MNKNPAKIRSINVVNDIQDMENIENINEDKENFYISKDTRFDIWDEVENYFNEYDSRNGFAIVKYRMEQNNKGQQVTISNTVSTIGQDLFSEIIKVLNKYLTEPINNIIKTEISQCLFVNVNLIKPSNEELNKVEKDKVLEIWKVIDIRNGVNSQESIIFNYKRDAYDNEGILSTRKLVTISTTVSTLKKAIRKRNLYNQIWGLARMATLLAVEEEDSEITTFLQDYIRRKSN
ncbi:431_t:CDS:2 [Diversispora eburnea]|uniref:431_t:CDS:1 n=1 Tax=Diversispora eburnea TaxID=1213867 RepID=A0A9N9A9X0_9GLOM|nr:431_t:CDS:2 [Diversispora eburnea]